MTRDEILTMDRVQEIARVFRNNPVGLGEFYKNCLTEIERQRKESPEYDDFDDEDLSPSDRVQQYVEACMQRLEQDPSSLEVLTSPPIYPLPHGLFIAEREDGRGYEFV